jgi:phytanoyl-CoA hydroxylase
MPVTDTSPEENLVQLCSAYSEQGYVIVRNLLGQDDYDPLGETVLDLVEARAHRRFSGLHDPELRDFFDANREVESYVYNAIRITPSIQSLGTDRRLARVVGALLQDERFGVLEKMILRIDLPYWEHEVAHWHQDYFYVRGNTEIITAWIPLQTVIPANGCLLVAPGSHALGVIEHTDRIGKRHCPPEDILDALTVVQAEMTRGDVLFFHSLLLHSGQLNRSEATRYSLQFRYSPAELPTDPDMGELIPLCS